METFFRYLRKIEMGLTVTFMGAFCVLGFLQVVFRYVGHPLPWTEEACRFFFIWSSFMGAVLVTANGEHFQVTSIVEFLPAQAQKVFRVLGYICIIVVSLILINYGTSFTMKGWARLSPTLMIRMGYIYSILPLSGILCIVHALGLAIEDIRKIFSRRSVMERAGEE